VFPEARTLFSVPRQLLPKRTEESVRPGIYNPLRLDQVNEWAQSIRPLIFRFSIREPAQTAKVTPIRRSLVATEPLGQRARCRRGQVFPEYLTVVQPCLKVSRRRFDYHRRRKPFLIHSMHGIRCQVIDQAQVVLPGGPDISVSTLAILPAEPRKRIEECLLIPRPWKHFRLLVAARGPKQTYLVKP